MLAHNPSIVLNGLVLALDAGNTKSYPGSGTTWTDLIGRGNTGTLTNGPTYNNTSGGSIVFDGTNDNVSIGTNGFSFGSSPGTLSAWAKTRDRTSTGTIVSYGNAATNGARFLGIGQSNFYFSGYGSSISASGLSYDTWFNMVGVYDGTNASMYVNGALVAGPTDRSSWNTVASNAGIGKNVNNSEYWQGDVAQVQIYNRALSAAEIQQNYNAFKGRYATYISGEEPTITVSVSPSSVQEDGTTNLVYTFTSDRIVTNNVTVNYSISGTATNGVDYTTIGTSVVIPTGSSSATVTVNPTDDSTGESGETVILTLANGEYAIGSPSSATGTILNDDSWIATLVGSGAGYDDAANDISVDNSGNIYVTGVIQTGSTSYATFTLKYNASGAIQWQKIAGGLNIALDASNNGYLTNGVSASSNYSQVQKFNSSTGSMIWKYNIANQDGGDATYGCSQVDSSGNVYIGSLGYAPSPNKLLYTTKINSNGTILWQRYLAPQNYNSRCIAVDPTNGDVYHAFISSTSTPIRSYIAKYDSSGVYIGTKRITNSDASVNGSDPTQMTVDSSGNVYISGSHQYANFVSFSFIIKFNFDTSTILWQKYSNTFGSSGTTNIIDSSNNIYISNGISVRKFDSSGIFQWGRTLSKTPYDLISDDPTQGFALDGYGNMIMGSVFPQNGNSGAPNNICIARLPADGSLTGTYGSFTYSTTADNSTTGAHTISSVVFSNTNVTSPQRTSAAVDVGISTLTSSVIAIG
jgi:hypothetical protein